MTKKFIYDYENISFTLTIPEYWDTIYKGQPRRKLYEDYVFMLDYVKKVDKSKYILDVGANHGLFSVPASMLGYKVIAFEPVKSNHVNLLEAEVDNHLKDFSMYRVALSNKNEITEIFVPECFDNASLNADAAIANMVHKDYITEVVIAMRFDEWIKSHEEFRNIGLIKLDVQGSEYNILEGMKEFLQDVHDVYLICEYEGHLNTMGHSFEELDNLITSYGFQYVTKNSNDKIFYKL